MVRLILNERNRSRLFREYLKMQEKLLEIGVYFSPLQRGKNFISTAHSVSDMDDAVNAVPASLGEAVL
jgi:glutamate-1-semialdehyde aminotransferase